MSLSGGENTAGFRTLAFAVFALLVLICFGGFIYMMTLKQDAGEQTRHRLPLPESSAPTVASPNLPTASPTPTASSTVFNPPLPPMVAPGSRGQFTE